MKIACPTAFAQTQARGGSKDGQYPCPGYKLIILDEVTGRISITIVAHLDRICDVFSG